MSLFQRFASNILRTLPISNLNMVRQEASPHILQHQFFASPLLNGQQMVRTKVRCYFPRPSERKRVKRHGWNTRMSTAEGRRTIMRRILKGRFVLTH